VGYIVSDETTARANPILPEIVYRLVSAYKPERIYLFSLSGRGDFHPDSDIDLMIVVPGNANAALPF